MKWREIEEANNALGIAINIFDFAHQLFWLKHISIGTTDTSLTPVKKCRVATLIWLAVFVCSMHQAWKLSALGLMSGKARNIWVLTPSRERNVTVTARRANLWQLFGSTLLNVLFALCRGCYFGSSRYCLLGSLRKAFRHLHAHNLKDLTRQFVRIYNNIFQPRDNVAVQLYERISCTFSFRKGIRRSDWNLRAPLYAVITRTCVCVSVAWNLSSGGQFLSSWGEHTRPCAGVDPVSSTWRTHSSTSLCMASINSGSLFWAPRSHYRYGRAFSSHREYPIYELRNEIRHLYRKHCSLRQVGIFFSSCLVSTATSWEVRQW